MDFNAMAAYAAVIAAGAAVVGVYTESKRARFALGVDLLMKVDERFNSEQIRKARRAAAECLVDKTKKDVSDTDDLLDFFDSLGLLTRRGALDEVMVWHTFFPWVNVYWNAANQYITSSRQKEPTLWANAAYLYQHLAAIEKRECGRSDSYTALTDDDIREFLIYESSLS